MKQEEGYNVAFRINEKTILGRTEDNLSISAKTKESLTKDDQGESQQIITGHEVTFSMNGLMSFNDAAETTQLDRDEILALAMLKGSTAVVPIKYAATDGDTYGGNAIITGYTEGSNSSDTATYSLNLKISGAFAKITA